MNKNAPKGWSEEQVKRVIDHYESQTDAEAAAEDDAAFNDPNYSIVLVPNVLVPKVVLMIQEYEDDQTGRSPSVKKPRRRSA